MDKVKLVDLKQEIFLRSALIPVDGLEDIFSLNDNYSGDKILGVLFKKSLRAWEYHHPFVYESKVHIDSLCSCTAPEGYCELKDNFKLYLDCMIGEDQITLISNTTPRIRMAGSYPGYPPSYVIAQDYRRPYIHLGTLLPQQVFFVKGLCSRPIIVDLDQSGNFTDKGAIYWINIDEGVQGQKFLDQCLVDILEYVRNLKSSTTFPNLGVDIFGSVDVAYQQLKGDLDQYYLQSSWRGELLD